MRQESWLGFQFRYLAALRAVKQEGSFRGAAERLGYVQSAISQHITRLEELVGRRLVERARGTTPVALTEAGELLAEHAEGILGRLRAARADLRALTHDGSVRVGVCHGFGTTILPVALERLNGSTAEMSVMVSEGATDAAHFEPIEAGELDLAFAELPLRPGPFDHVALMSDPRCLVVPADHPLALRPRPPSLAEIATLELIVHPAWRGLPHLDWLLRAGQAEPVLRECVLTPAAIQGLVGAAQGATVLPYSAIDVADTHVAAIDLGHLLEPATIALYWHADRQLPTAVADLRDAIQAACARRPPATGGQPEPALSVA
jgi:DNA-binding transcriptional LysR family regulator